MGSFVKWIGRVAAPVLMFCVASSSLFAEQAQPPLVAFEANVHQKKYFADIGEEVTFYGTVKYLRPGCMLWEFTAPDPSALLITPEGAWLTVPGIKQVQKMGPRAQEKIRSFLMGFEQSTSELAKEYTMEWGATEQLEQGSAKILKLTRPQDPFVREIVLWLDVDRGYPLRISWTGTGGDLTVTDFIDARINGKLEPGVFGLRIPKDFEVVTQEIS